MVQLASAVLRPASLFPQRASSLTAWYVMGLAGDVLVFIADCEPICARQARVEILQAAAIESCARDGHFRFISQVASTSSLYEDSQHRASSGPLRLLRWSRGDRAGLKADVQIWVTFPKEFDEVVAKLHFCTRAVLTVYTQEQPDYIGLKVEDPFKDGR